MCTVENTTQYNLAKVSRGSSWNMFAKSAVSKYFLKINDKIRQKYLLFLSRHPTNHVRYIFQIWNKHIIVYIGGCISLQMANQLFQPNKKTENLYIKYARIVRCFSYRKTKNWNCFKIGRNSESFFKAHCLLTGQEELLESEKAVRRSLFWE